MTTTTTSSSTDSIFGLSSWSLLQYFVLTQVFLLFWSTPFIYSLLTSCVLFWLYYEIFACKVPTITTGNSSMAVFLSTLPILNSKFRPSPLYFEGRLQTIFGLRKRLPAEHKIKYDSRDVLNMKDGGMLGIDYLSCKDANGNELNRPTILLLPGLTSSSQTSYVKSLATEIRRAGFNLIVYNTRGLGGVPLVTPRWACGADCEDLHAAILYIKNNKLRNGEKLFVVGASFGGMLLSQLLLTHPDDCDQLFHGAMVISTIFDMNALLESLDKPYFNKYVLNQGVTLDILGRAQKFPTVMHSVPEKWDFDYACKATTLRELDRRLTCPMFGFSGPEEYYKKATTVDRLDQIRIPFFVLNAEDDPMQPGESLPLARTAANSDTNVAFITTARGGHLGFLEGSGMKTSHFMERVVVELISGYHSHQCNISQNGSENDSDGVES